MMNDSLRPQRPIGEVRQAILQNEAYYDRYIDGLMLMHDLLCEFATTQGMPQFSPEEIRIRMAQLISASHQPAKDKDTHDVFLSHRTQDAAITVQIAEALSKYLDVWFWRNQQDISEVEWEAALNRTRSLVIVLSPDTPQSVWIRRELDRAIQRDIPIIPVLVRGDERTAMPHRLIGHRYIDIRTKFAGGIQKLIREIQQQLDFEAAHRAEKTLPDAVADNLQQNYAIAQELRSRALQSGQDEPHIAEETTRFLQGLLQIYTTLRIARQETKTPA